MEWIQRSREAAHATRGVACRARAAAAAAVAGRVLAPWWTPAARAAASAALVSAWYLAAITGLNRSIGHTARHTASRRAGRPRREMCAWPDQAPEALSAGGRPAGLDPEG